jgi:hypothetical protein
MDECKLIIETDLSEQEKALVKDYWEMNNGVFVNTPQTVATKYNIPVGKLQHVLKHCAYYLFTHAPCSECGNDLSIKAHSHLRYHQTKKATMVSCQVCIDRRWEGHNKANERGKAHKLDNHKTAIAELELKDLTPYEREVLRTIVDNNIKNVSQLRKHVFGGTLKDKRKEWAAFLSLESKSLIIVERDKNKNNYVTSIEFDHSLKEALREQEDKTVSNGSNAGFGFVLQPDGDNHTHNFQGTFTLTQDIVFKAGEACTYFGYLNADGSLSVRISPLDSLNKAPEMGGIKVAPVSRPLVFRAWRDDDEEPPF